MGRDDSDHITQFKCLVRRGDRPGLGRRVLLDGRLRTTEVGWPIPLAIVRSRLPDERLQFVLKPAGTALTEPRLPAAWHDPAVPTRKNPVDWLAVGPPPTTGRRKVGPVITGAVFQPVEASAERFGSAPTVRTEHDVLAIRSGGVGLDSQVEEQPLNQSLVRSVDAAVTPVAVRLWVVWVQRVKHLIVRQGSHPHRVVNTVSTTRRIP